MALSAHHPALAVAAFDDVGQFRLFGDGAHETFKDVAEGDDALQGAQLVAHETKACAVFFQVFQCAVHGHRFREVDGFLQTGFQVKGGLAQLHHQVFQSHIAAHAVHVLIGQHRVVGKGSLVYHLLHGL